MWLIFFFVLLLGIPLGGASFVIVCITSKLWGPVMPDEENGIDLPHLPGISPGANDEEAADCKAPRAAAL